MQALFLPSAASKLVGCIGSCDVRLLLFTGCFVVPLVTNSDSPISEIIALNPEFYDVFKQDKCPRLEFKRSFVYF